MFNSIRPKTTSEECHSSNPIATGIIIHDHNLDRPSWLHRVWQSLVHLLVQRNELQIWQESNHLGQQIWRAYDPKTKQSAYCYTEAELIDWLEHQINS